MVQVTDHDGYYDLRFQVVVPAPVERVRALVTDYAHLQRLVPDIVRSTLLPARHGLKLRVVFRACVWIFCKTVTKTEWVNSAPGGVITTRAIPSQSDFRYAVERWRIARAGDGTLISYRGVAAPKFHVPPVIGPWLIRTVMERELSRSVARLRRLSR
ncbi:MAG: SRPBCC family protein [Acidiferrobacteraceae bacterium]